MFDLPLSARLATMATFGYAVGCLNAGYYLVRARRGADLRAVHSGNAGATNAGRVLGRRGFAVVLMLDALKGTFAALLGASLAGYPGAATGALAAVCGHVWPAQLGWRGGKGIATAIGAFLVVEPLATSTTITVAFLLFAMSRRWSASGLSAVMLAPIILVAVGRPPRAAIAVAIAGAVVLLAHRDELRALWTTPTA